MAVRDEAVSKPLRTRLWSGGEKEVGGRGTLARLFPQKRGHPSAVQRGGLAGEEERARDD